MHVVLREHGANGTVMAVLALLRTFTVVPLVNLIFRTILSNTSSIRKSVKLS